MRNRLWVWLLFLSVYLSGCADNDFFQEDALATEAELQGRTPAGPDSAWVIAGRHYDRNGLHRFFWGDHNRSIWTTPVKLPVFDLHEVKGGLSVEDIGGGFQTTSFDLQDSTGRHYAFRSIDKNPVEVVSPFWQKTFVVNILRDQTSAANPYAALVVPVLAEAVQVPHSTPTLYYVSKTDTTFGEYAPLVQGRLFMLEEEYNGPTDLTPAFGDAVNFADSEDALKLRFNDNTYHFDQHAFARARLLDLLIGDWDRHKGQWDWAVVRQGSDTYFRPVPKDRDQVFLQIQDGLIPSIATSKILARKLKSFDDDFKDVKAYMINAEFVDNRLLHELSLKEWQQIAQTMQAVLTDEVIQKAVRQLPPPVHAQIGPRIAHQLQRRRDLLPKAAAEMYEILAEKVTIPGTDQTEHFRVKRLDEGRTEVTVTRPAKGAVPAKQLYHRVFSKDETELITLHGLAEDDVFEISGEVKDAIQLKVYGGLGEDDITDTSRVQGWKKMTRIYDTDRGNDIVLGSEARDMTTDDVRVHAYDREGN
ncbi:hypothetical protein CLV24_10965 [Pontibacter ummariensis]|uniref:DKNYY family protein n=1 Tax=Pontibacter ummariensis TaxID=1610492 RepID=A0A239FSN0_9BACT|nr:hypothetical protein [Pontibacter ummariensis]PRY11940.1 hypothetical protein CLV24_10965 [Pontibacter ummariensis]SNS59891.1 hypothetical protein SAMN06296052_109105 [Pontibacter ummariensis]